MLETKSGEWPSGLQHQLAESCPVSGPPNLIVHNKEPGLPPGPVTAPGAQGAARLARVQAAARLEVLAAVQHFLLE